MTAMPDIKLAKLYIIIDLASITIMAIGDIMLAKINICKGRRDEMKLSIHPFRPVIHFW
jgi:hypothetical protein